MSLDRNARQAYFATTQALSAGESVRLHLLIFDQNTVLVFATGKDSFGIYITKMYWEISCVVRKSEPRMPEYHGKSLEDRDEMGHCVWLQCFCIIIQSNEEKCSHSSYYEMI